MSLDIATTPVEGSSNVAAFGYDERNQVLRVEFKNGGIYDFLDVTPEEHQAMKDADSKGKYVQSNIRLSKLFKKVS